MTTDRTNRSRQGDLFSGKWTTKPPRRGNGSHVRLKPLEGEKPVVPGMASYAGGGPRGKYCKDCDHFGEIAVQTGADAVEMNRAGCVIYAQHMAHAAPTGRGSIGLCRACRYFMEPAGTSIRRFVVDQVGVVHRFDDFPADLRKWRPGKRDDGRAAPPDAEYSTRRER